MTPRHVGVQRLEMLVAVMLARERRVLADAQDGGCTELAGALATLPSGVFQSVAEAVAALGGADPDGMASVASQRPTARVDGSGST